MAQRMERHAKGQVHYTSSCLPVACIAAFGFVDRYIAYKFEKHLQTGKGRAF